MTSPAEKAREIADSLDLTVQINGEWHELRGIERDKLSSNITAALEAERKVGYEEGMIEEKMKWLEIEKISVIQEL